MVKRQDYEDGRDGIPERRELLEKSDGGTVTITASRLSVLDKGKTEVQRVNNDDPISSLIGEYGRWQLLMTFLLALFSFPCTFHIFSTTFTAGQSEFWCRKPSNTEGISLAAWKNFSLNPILGGCRTLDLNWNTTTESDLINLNFSLHQDDVVKCKSWDWNREEFEETIISEWGLVCDRANIPNVADVVFLTGVGIGGGLGGFISDKFGRKKVLMTTFLIQSILGISIAYCPTIELYIFLKLIMGVCSVSVVFAAFVLVVELVGGKWVTISGVCNFLPLPLSYIIVSLLSLAFPSWRNLQLVLSLPGIILLSLWWVLPESPKWLLSMGRTKEVIKIVQKAAKFNKLTLPQSIDKILQQPTSDTREDGKLSMLFRKPLHKRTALLFVTWFAMTLGYYGIVLNTGNLNMGNLHRVSILLALVEIPAIILSIPLLLKAGRKVPIIATLLLCGISCVCIEIFSFFFNDHNARIFPMMIGRFTISATNIMLPTYTAELYPTILRNLGVGACQISAGLALMIVPYLWSLESLGKALPMVTLGVLSVVGGVCVAFLPETMNSKISCIGKKSPLDVTASNSNMKAMSERKSQCY